MIPPFNKKTVKTPKDPDPIFKNGKDQRSYVDDKGYLLSNLKNYTPKKVIKSSHITTKNMAFPIIANGVPLYPNTGDYIFPQNQVIETPMMYQQGGPMPQQQQAPQQGGQQDIMQVIAQALQQGTPPEQLLQMLVEQGIPQEEAQQMIQQVMAQMQGQQPQMQAGGFSPRPNYKMTGSDWVDSSNYKQDFYNTPNLAVTPSRSPSNTTFGINYSPNGSAYNNSDLEWQLYQGLPYTVMNSDRQDVKNLAHNRSMAYEDYQNQFYQFIKQQADKNPKVKKALNKNTPFKFEKGGMRPKKMKFDY